MSFKISDLLPATLPLTGDELLEVTQGGNSRSVSVADLAASGSDGEDGVGITGTTINSAGHLIVSYSDGSTQDAGLVKDEDGLPDTSYASATITSGAVSLDASVSRTWSVTLTEPISSFAIVGAVAGKTTTVDVIFTQLANNFAVAFPGSVKIQKGVSALVSTARFDISVVRLRSTDGGATWLANQASLFTAYPANARPTIADNNATFNDECSATTGWTITNGTMAVSGSVLRNTKTSAAGSSSAMSKAISYPAANKDYLLYGKIRGRYATSNATVLWLTNGTKYVSLWLGSPDGGVNEVAGAISIRGNVGATATNASVATGFNYEANWVEFLLWYDDTYSTVSCYFREPDGSWLFKARVNCDYFQSANVSILTNSNSAAGNWAEVDYVTMCRPNIVNIGDSIQEGKTLFANDPALSLTNYESTWMRHAPIYAGLRNNFIVNKGIAGNTSAQILARISDATDQLPRLVYLGASNNDFVNSVTQATRTSNIQNTINAITAAGAQCVLLNSPYGTSSLNYNLTPAVGGYRDYHKTWWDTHRPTLTNLYGSIDTMYALGQSDGYCDASLIQSDGAHPNVAGYTAMGKLFSS